MILSDEYNEDDTHKEMPRINLPFPVIETINGSRARRAAKTVG